MNYNLNTLLPLLSAEVKFKRDFNPTYKNKLDSTLVGTSNSGLYFNSGVSSFVNIKNICSLIDFIGDWTISDYAAGTTYSKDEIVTSESNHYLSLADDNVGKLLTNTSYWYGPTTLESIIIKRDVNTAIEQVLAHTIPAPKLLDHELIYTVSDLSDTITNESNYVGFELRPSGSEHLKVVLNQIGAQFTAANNNTPIYLYKNNTLKATGSFDNVINEFKWTDLTSFELTGNARWFIFYDQDAISGEATNWDLYYANKVSRFVEMLPFEVPNTTTNFLQDVDAYTENSYGLGLNISVFGDLTNFISQNAQMFAETIQLQYCLNFLERGLNNPSSRINDVTRTFFKDEATKNIILGELKSDSENSLVTRLKRSYSRLKKSLKFGDAVLTCDDENSFITHTNFG